MSKLNLLLAVALLSIAGHAQFVNSETARKAGERMARGDKAGAIAILDAAIAKGKDLNEAYKMRAEARLSSGDLRGGVADLSSAIELKPNDPHLYKERAQFRLFLRDNDGARMDYD